MVTSGKRWPVIGRCGWLSRPIDLDHPSQDPREVPDRVPFFLSWPLKVKLKAAPFSQWLLPVLRQLGGNCGGGGCRICGGECWENTPDSEESLGMKFCCSLGKNASEASRPWLAEILPSCITEIILQLAEQNACLVVFPLQHSQVTAHPASS